MKACSELFAWPCDQLVDVPAWLTTAQYAVALAPVDALHLQRQEVLKLYPSAGVIL